MLNNLTEKNCQPFSYKLPDESNPNGIGYDQISNNRKKLPTKAIEKI